MPKVKKVLVPSGAPAYMSQFTMIMLILVCMCMIMSMLAKSQESGFKGGEGMGKVKKANALGIVIGTGVFRFGSSGKARTFADNPGDQETEVRQNPSLDLVKGEGGSGNTDLSAKDLESVKFIFVRLNGKFPPNSATITKQIDAELLGFGTGMSMFDFILTIKCYCAEYKDANKNRELAFERGLRIMRDLNKRFNVPLTKMSCVVFQDRSLIMKDSPQPATDSGAQGQLAPEQAQNSAAQPTQETAFVMKVR